MLPCLQVLLVEFYKGAPDLVKFQEAWSPEHTYLDKLKVRLWTPTPGPVGSTGYSLLSGQQFPMECQGRSQDMQGPGPHLQL